MARILVLSLTALIISTEINAQAISPISAKQIQLLLATAPNTIGTSNSDSVRKRPFTYRDNRISQPLLVVEGKIVAYEALSGMNPQHIENIVVVKGEEAIKQFGAGGINGVIILTMKKQQALRHKKIPLN
ncbi:TonB-dependent receptor plug domain-containing protein [Hymenobacter sp. UYCo722]|uniref:TonB-dependent receptor plug domain-containing protein n=1 Tax=Hymenobacter sp. UYCo722 TaxID=3156335 RepID=UPI00339B583B